MRTIKFRAKHFKTGEWFYGSNLANEHDDSYANIKNEKCNLLPLSTFWDLVEQTILLPDTVGQFVEWTNFDGSKGEGFEGDIIAHGGDNHNSVIKFGEEWGEAPCFYTEESALRSKDGRFKRTHGLPPNTATNNVIGNIWDNKKLRYRWGRS